MTNSYVTQDELKRVFLDIIGVTDDTRLRRLTESVSRLVDGYVSTGRGGSPTGLRHFYELASAKTFDGPGTFIDQSPNLVLINGRFTENLFRRGIISELEVPDLVSIDTNGLKTDDDLDRTFETTWAVTDRLLIPNNADPANASNPESQPFRQIHVDRDAGTKSSFPVGVQSIQVTGKWGYWRHLLRATETVNDNPLVAASTTLTVTSATDIQAGHTLLVETEQIYVQERDEDNNTFKVRRGVNGTTAASHVQTTVIDIYEYPDEVREATLIQTGRLWTRKDTLFATIVGFSETGQMQIQTELDPDMKRLLQPYRLKQGMKVL